MGEGPSGWDRHAHCAFFIVLTSFDAFPSPPPPHPSQEEIRDLLSKDHKKRLELKERPDTGVYVKVSKAGELTHSYLA